MTAPLPSAWRPYSPWSTSRSITCARCGMISNAAWKGLAGWFWRPLTGTGQRGRRTEAVCPGCAEGMGVEK